SFSLRFELKPMTTFDLSFHEDTRKMDLYFVVAVVHLSDSGTKVCSFGKQVVEKVETEWAQLEDGRFMYHLLGSIMCEYLVNFLHKLRQLLDMNGVLENFTILQMVTNRDTQELLVCTAYVFEVSTSECGAQHHIYRLVRD
ncbi:hypothetical protein STEG23_007581, partial [Scotinomys teguina]